MPESCPLGGGCRLPAPDAAPPCTPLQHHMRTTSTLSHWHRELHAKFVVKVQEFMAALADAHRTAHSERSDSREELESLLNLMSRLDFNGCMWWGGVGRACWWLVHRACLLERSLAARVV